MGRKDIKSNVDVDQSLTKIARTATATGDGVDVSDFHGAFVLIDSGAWTDGTHTFEVQDSDDDSTYAAVADSLLDGSEPVIDGATDDDQKYRIGYMGNKPYLRVVQTVTGGPSTGLVSGALIIKGEPSLSPAS